MISISDESVAINYRNVEIVTQFIRLFLLLLKRVRRDHWPFFETPQIHEVPKARFHNSIHQKRFLIVKHLILIHGVVNCAA